eukprot:TRINITY_DN8752_c0_g1_i1.p1 TRINITY_DN8752_c0_g1~~TRINITY_DN8752_c0_g1_i1.p1  ORF type:complete len:545 (+),score=183.93 TRINITY_DN8752_c0_g1_i1:67-1701(+)
MYRHSAEAQRDYLRRSGALSLLNNCAVLLAEHRPRDPAAFLSGVLGRQRGLRLEPEELANFVRRSDRAHPALILRTLQLSCPPDASPTTPPWGKVLDRSADLFVFLCQSVTQLQRLEESVPVNSLPRLVRLALVMARCKLLVRANAGPLHVTVVVPLHCASAVLRRHEVHPQGENLVVAQNQQLRWLLEGQNTVTCQLLYVDELCPDSSGAVARLLAQAEGIPGDQVRVVSLYDGMQSDEVAPGHSLPPSFWLKDCATAPLANGAAYAYGMHVAAVEPACGDRVSGDSQVVVLAAADVSVHLAQIGELLQTLQTSADVAYTDETLPGSVPRQPVSRSHKLFTYLWRRLFPQVSGVMHCEPQLVALRAPLARQLAPLLASRRVPLALLEVLLRSVIRKGPDKVSGIPVMRHGRMGCAPPLDYPDLLAGVTVLAEAVARDHPAVADSLSVNAAWVELLKRVNGSRWDRLLASPACDSVCAARDLEQFSLSRFAPSAADFTKGDTWEEEERRKQEEEEAEKLRQDADKKAEEDRARKDRRRRSRQGR